MPYAPTTVSNRFLQLATGAGRPLSPMQAQKLVYFAHGMHLARDLGPLCDEEPQAWLYGPVFPSLYHALKIWGGAPILKPARTPREVVDARSQEIIELAWNVYGHMRAMQLSNRSHDPDGPWFKVRERTGGDHFAVIPNTEIRAYFKALNHAHSPAG